MFTFVRNMDILLKALEQSIQHLKTIDDVFTNSDYSDKRLYMMFKQNIADLNNKFAQKFTDELYVGGKKGVGESGYGRQMILSDVFEYIVNGRGYYYAEWSLEKKQVFIQIILNLINQLIIWDSLTVEAELRKDVMTELQAKMGANFFKEQEMKNRHAALLAYSGDIGFDTFDDALPPEVHKLVDPSGEEKVTTVRGRIDNYFDSLLPKTAGGLWGELIVYLYLLRRNLGYVLPLLLNQRLLHGGSTKSLKPPDYLLIRKDGTLTGIEVGGSKETQSSHFSSTLRGCQMVTVQNPRVPPRCPICGKKTLFCPKVIKDFSDIDTNPLLSISEDIFCAHNCSFYVYDQVIAGECPYILYFGKTSPKTVFRQKRKFDTEYHFHYSCILKQKDDVALSLIRSRADRFEAKMKETSRREAEESCPVRVLKMNYPYVEGLETYEKLVPRDEIVCYGKYPNKNNCTFCNFTEQCKKLTAVEKALKDVEGLNRQQATNELRRLLP